ncbi:MAG: EAL domain-containing protein [Eubacteriales bacterium]|jgi:diguanylate cyclase (GGDEF)-like protein|nr:EAL domain-containing protein [Eubacteriales bacterium]
MRKMDDPAYLAEPSQQKLPEDEMQLLLENMISRFSYYRMIYDENGRAVDYVILAVNRAFETETGLRREDVIGKRVLSVYPLTEPYWIECFGRVAKTGVSEHISNYSAALGKWYDIVAYSPKPEHVAITVNDITGYISEQHALRQTAKELKAQQQENYRIAHEEPITGLPNRASLYDAFAQRAEGGADAHFLIAIFAPDNLAEILASYGSVLSDIIMRTIAQRLDSLFSGQHACYSMTGTDLVLLIPLPCEEQQIYQELSRAQQAIRIPVNVDGADYYISASCGVACFPRDGTDRDELIMKANLALYQAKKSGEAIVLFSERIGERLQRRQRIRNALPKALSNEEFELYFQPQVHTASARLLGFEALLRWHSPELGEVAPLECISIAEESRLIFPLGAWVLRNACQTLREINSNSRVNYMIAVNVSGVQLRADNFVEQVLAVLKETEIPPELLELEVTESVLVNRELHAIEKLNMLHERGVRIALDDFGTGFSSLSMLKDLKISTLKIDKVFIHDSNMAGLAKMIVRLGHLFGASVVAEGVETEEQMRFAQRAGCDRVQGYYQALPMPLESLKRYLGTKAHR